MNFKIFLITGTDIKKYLKIVKFTEELWNCFTGGKTPKSTLHSNKTLDNWAQQTPEAMTQIFGLILELMKNHKVYIKYFCIVFVLFCFVQICRWFLLLIQF